MSQSTRIETQVSELLTETEPSLISATAMNSFLVSNLFATMAASAESLSEVAAKATPLFQVATELESTADELMAMSARALSSSDIDFHETSALLRRLAETARVR